MQEFFPSTRKEYLESVEEYGEVLETLVIEDIFMPQILRLLAKNEENIFSITVLEILGNDKMILDVAKKYMGQKTALLQVEADRDLGRL